MAKYLDYPGLSYFWNKIKSWIRNYTHASYDQMTGRTTVVVDNITFDVSHKLPADYAPSTLENDALNPAANDSYDLAFSKIHKAIKDTERVTAEALTDLDSRVNELDELKAPKASPSLTGIPTAPTAASGTNTTQIATTAFVQEAVNSGTGSVTVDGIKGSTINRYGVCSTAAATAAKTVSITTGTLPTLNASATGTRITIKFTNANTADNPKLNVNSTGSKNILFRGSIISTNNMKKMLAGVCDFVYDDSTDSWHLVGSDQDNKIIINGVSRSFYADSAQYFYTVCTTASDIGAKTASEPSNDQEMGLDVVNNGGRFYCPTGMYMLVNFQNANTANNPTFSYWGTEACSIYHRGVQITTGNNKSLLAGVCALVFDGSVWNLVGNYYDSTYTVGNKALKVSSNTGTATQAITMNENSSDRTLQIKGDGTYLSGAVSGSDNAPVITLTPTNSGATAGSYGDSSNQTPTYGGTFKVPYITVDAKGRVTGISEHTVKIPATDDTDVKVTQTALGNIPGAYPLLVSNSANTNTETSGVNKTGNLTYNPFIKNLSNSGGTFNGKTLGQGNSELTTSDTTKIPTSAEVASFVSNQIASAQVGAAMFQGIIKSDNVAPAPTALPTTGYKKGQYWIVGTAGTYAGQVCEVGDTIFCVEDYVSGSASNSDFNIVQNNIDTITNSEIDSIESWPASS